MAKPIRIAYLGPAGTFSEEALHTAAGGAEYVAVPCANIPRTISAVQKGEAEFALVPIENSIEGSVRSTLDVLAVRQIDVEIVGEYSHVVSPSLIGRNRPLEEITVVYSHPQPISQCSVFLERHLPNAELRETASTADGIRRLGEFPDEPWAAIGPTTAAALYDLPVLAEGIANSDDNETRFVWLAPAGSDPGSPASGDYYWRTTLVFAELGEDHPGALVDALRVFSDRGVNLTRIESRPMRTPGADSFTSYMFFVDLEGSLANRPVLEAVAVLGEHAAWVKTLGSYPIGIPGLPRLA